MIHFNKSHNFFNKVILTVVIMIFTGGCYSVTEIIYDNSTLESDEMHTEINSPVPTNKDNPLNIEPNTDEAMEVINMNTYFTYKKITKDIEATILGKSYPKNATIPISHLRYVQVLYYGFDEETHIGELIVNKAVADDVVDIFKELYEAKYPIERIVLIDEYGADDEASMRDNNTSAFNYRTVAGTNKLSKHSMGVAVDINPLYNPYITTINGEETILPSTASDYTDRTKDFPYKIEKDDICYNAFIKRGWTWGGEWTHSKDYQHFQKTID